jgi:hypothetical protein
MTTKRPSNTVPRSAIAAILAIILLAAGTAAAQAPPPGAPPGDQVNVPDSRGWTIEQAVVNLRASDKGARLAALNRLAREPGPNINQWIVEAARFDPEPRIRYEAVLILGRRKEPESLPALMIIAEKDADERVRTAAWNVAQAAGVRPGPAPAPAGQPGAGPAPAPAQPPPATPPPQKRYDEHGNELPPGYLDGEGGGPGAAASFDSPLGRPVVDMEYVDKGRQEAVHHGFMGALGYDGAIGSPRDTLARNRVGLQVGFESSGVSNTIVSERLVGLEIQGLNDFTSNDFSLLVDGSWAPLEFLELGLGFEVLTVEKLVHAQAWEWAEGTNEGETIERDSLSESTYLYHDASYSGAALGFLSLDLKALLHRSELLRLGLAARVTFPTHTGETLNRGIGAQSLFLSTAQNSAIRVNRTENGSLWGVEPGIVFSLAPVAGLSIFGDLSVAMLILGYDWYREEVVNNQVQTFRNRMSAFDLFLIPNLGAQYRILDDTLGFQVALQPAIYLGTAVDASLASFGIVPGVSYTLFEHLVLSLTFAIEATPDAPRPLLCTDLEPSDKDAPLPCGVGRRFGLALKTSWVF